MQQGPLGEAVDKPFLEFISKPTSACSRKLFPCVAQMFLQPGPGKTAPFYCSPNRLGLAGLERWACFQRNVGISLLEQFLKKRMKLFPAGGVGRAGSCTPGTQ